MDCVHRGLFALVALGLAACADYGSTVAAPAGPNFSTIDDGRATIVVNPSANGNGVAQTIQEGMDMVADGGRVLIRPGTYAELVTITKGLELVAVGGESAPVILAPPGPVRINTTSPVVIRGVTVQGRSIQSTGVAVDLTVENVSVLSPSGGTGLSVVWAAPTGGGPARLVVRDSYIEGFVGAGSAGISFQGDVNALIERNVVRGSTSRCINVAFGAVNAVVATTADVIGNDLDRCGTESGITVTTNGVRSTQRTANVIGNTIRNSGAQLIRTGIYYEGFTGRVEHNSIVNVVLASVNPARQNVIGCCFLAPGGIFVGSFRGALNATPVVRFNDVSGNAFAGLRVAQATLIDASCNWWGAADGPSGVGGGSGDAIVVEAGASPPTFSPFAPAPIASTEATSC